MAIVTMLLVERVPAMLRVIVCGASAAVDIFGSFYLVRVICILWIRIKYDIYITSKWYPINTRLLGYFCQLLLTECFPCSPALPFS
jgi:hypothetical protein